MAAAVVPRRGTATPTDERVSLEAPRGGTWRATFSPATDGLEE